MPGGGWSKTTSSCITKSTCSATTIPYTSIFTKPETSVSTCVTSYPSTHTGSETKVYTTTEASSTVGKSTETVWSTVTKSNVWTTYTQVSYSFCLRSSVFHICIDLFFCGLLTYGYVRSAPRSQLSLRRPGLRLSPWSLMFLTPQPSTSLRPRPPRSPKPMSPTLLPQSTRLSPLRSLTLLLVTAPRASVRALSPGRPGAGKLSIVSRTCWRSRMVCDD